MVELIDHLNALCKENQILSTVAGGSIIVFLVSNTKAILSWILDGITALISFRLVNTYEDGRGHGNCWFTDSQRYFNDFISSTPAIWERTNNIDLSSKTSEHYSERGYLKESAIFNFQKLTYGFSIRIIFGKLAIVHRSLETHQKITVTTTIRVFFGFKKPFIEKLHRAIAAYIGMEKDLIPQRPYVAIGFENGHSEKMKRSMDTVYTNNGEHYRLLNSIKAFLENKDKYKSLSFPYKYTAILYGEPGCGKTSSILAVASALNRDISYINLGKTNVDQLMFWISQSKNNIIVFEDIDACVDSVSENRESDKNNGDGEAAKAIRKACSTRSDISLSDLLNITDGLLASDGAIMIFTTNHIEKLDPAFLRSGRMNSKIEFTRFTRDTAARMIKANLAVDIDPSVLKDKIVPAELQETILNITLGNETLEDLGRKFYEFPAA